MPHNPFGKEVLPNVQPKSLTGEPSISAVYLTEGIKMERVAAEFLEFLSFDLMKCCLKIAILEIVHGCFI